MMELSSSMVKILFLFHDFIEQRHNNWQQNIKKYGILRDKCSFKYRQIINRNAEIKMQSLKFISGSVVL